MYKQECTGNADKIIWKRLQPQVREMCDVCSTTVFNVHWTCAECAAMVCIDCYKTRRQGYPLAYMGKAHLGQEADDNGVTNQKPYKSRRKLKLRKDIDDHYWPLCKDMKAHTPSKFTLTTYVCGDALKVVRHKKTFRS